VSQETETTNRAELSPSTDAFETSATWSPGWAGAEASTDSGSTIQPPQESAAFAPWAAVEESLQRSDAPLPGAASDAEWDSTEDAPVAAIAAPAWSSKDPVLAPDPATWTPQPPTDSAEGGLVPDPAPWTPHPHHEPAVTAPIDDAATDEPRSVWTLASATASLSSSNRLLHEPASEAAPEFQAAFTELAEGVSQPVAEAVGLPWAPESMNPESVSHESVPSESIPSESVPSESVSHESVAQESGVSTTATTSLASESPAIAPMAWSAPVVDDPIMGSGWDLGPLDAPIEEVAVPPVPEAVATKLPASLTAAPDDAFAALSRMTTGAADPTGVAKKSRFGKKETGDEPLVERPVKAKKEKAPKEPKAERVNKEKLEKAAKPIKEKKTAAVAEQHESELVSEGKKKSFFAKRTAEELDADTPKSTPSKALRAAAALSLLGGVGLFGYTLLSEKSKPADPAVTVAPTTPTASTPAGAGVNESSIPKQSVPVTSIASNGSSEPAVSDPNADPSAAAVTTAPASSDTSVPLPPVSAAPAEGDDLEFSSGGNFGS
jgi:hypothetical protein